MAQAVNGKLKVTIISFFVNIVLSTLKLYAALLTGSMALLSDAVNSITDILSSLSGWIGVQVGEKKADKEYPYGHKSAEPVAGLVIAIFAAVVGFEVVKSSILEFLRPSNIVFEQLAVGFIGLSIIIKVALFYYAYLTHKRIESPVLASLTVDYRNDIIVSCLALIGYMIGTLWTPKLDMTVALVVGIFIIYSALDIGKQNIHFLMGGSPPKAVLGRIRKVAAKVEGVKRTNDLYAHYIGNKIHVEVHINIDNHLDTVQGHDIGKKVQWAVEALDIVDRAFVHIDPAERVK